MPTPVTIFVIVLLSIAFFCILGREKYWERVARRERQKNMLLAIVSHQMRTPVTTIKWYIEMLLNGDFEKLRKAQVDPLRKMNSAAGHLVQLTGRLLESSRIEHTGIRCQPVDIDVQENIQLVIDSLEDKIAEKQHRVDFHRLKKRISCRIDPLVFHASIGVLLNNAIAYTPRGGEINIFARECDGRVELRITDSGPGLPVDRQRRCFSRAFRKEKKRLLFTAGGGIGLYLAQQLMQEAGCKMWFHSEEGRGTTFFIVMRKARV